jgi:hypothetical protein
MSLTLRFFSVTFFWYREWHEKKENIHRVFEEIDYETGEIL